MEFIQSEQPAYEDARFPVLFHGDQLSGARRSLYTNWHTGIELLHIHEGEGALLLDSEEYPFRAGDLAVIRSNVLHSMTARSAVCTYDCLIVEPDYLAGFGFDMERAAFFEVVRDEAAARLFDDVAAAFAAGGELMRPAATAALLALFVDLYARHRYRGAAPRRHVGGNYPLVIMQALRYIHTNLCTPIAIDDICKHVNISKYYFCRMFRAHTGHAVLHYVNLLRCEYGRKLMVENGLNVSEAAYQLGIHNLSYFTRLYRRYMGKAPSLERRPEARRGRRADEERRSPAG